MSTRAPQWVLDLIAHEFTPDQLEVIATHWYAHWQGSMTNSDVQEFINTGHALLWITGTVPEVNRGKQFAF